MLLKLDNLTFYRYYLQGTFNIRLPTEVPIVELAKLTMSKLKSDTIKYEINVNILRVQNIGYILSLRYNRM